MCQLIPSNVRCRSILKGVHVTYCNGVWWAVNVTYNGIIRCNVRTQGKSDSVSHRVSANSVHHTYVYVMKGIWAKIYWKVVVVVMMAVELLATSVVRVGGVRTSPEVERQPEVTGARLGVGHRSPTDAATVVCVVEMERIVKWTRVQNPRCTDYKRNTSNF